MWFRSGLDVLRFGPDGSIATPTGGFMVHETADGSVWIAYHDQYRLVRYYQGVFSDVPLPPPVPHQWIGMYPEQGVLAMATDTDGALLLLTPSGFVRAVDGKLTAPEPLRLPSIRPNHRKCGAWRWIARVTAGWEHFPQGCFGSGAPLFRLMPRTRGFPTHPFAPFFRTAKAAFGSAEINSTGLMAIGFICFQVCPTFAP